MAENINTGLTVEAWAEITIKEWVKKAQVLGVAPNNPLDAERFVHHINTAANGDPARIEFIYDYYLNFVDWGVGKGVDLEHRDMLISSGATKRRPKRWFTDVFYKQVTVLTHLLAEKYALQAAHVVVNATKFDEKGNAAPSQKKSGSSSSVDSVTGRRKITFKEFEERRKQNGW